MAFQLKGGLYIEKAATDLMIAADTEEMMQEGWLRSMFWRRRNTDQLSGIYRQQSIGDQLRIYDVDASFSDQNDALQEVEFQLDPDVYFNVRPFGLETVIDYVENAAADPVINYASRKTQDAKFKFFNSLEKLSVDQLRNPAILNQGRNLTNAERLDNYLSNLSNPILQLYMLCHAIKNDVGNMPNIIAIDDLVWTYGFLLHPYILSRSPVQVPPSIVGAGATMTTELLEKILGLAPGTIVIYRKRYNPSRRGEPEKRLSHLGSDIVGAYVQDPNLFTTGFGHEVAFTGLGELPADYPFAVLTFEDPKRGLYGSQRVRIVSLVNWTVTRARSAYRITNTVDLTDQNKYFYLGFAVLN